MTIIAAENPASFIAGLCDWDEGRVTAVEPTHKGILPVETNWRWAAECRCRMGKRGGGKACRKAYKPIGLDRLNKSATS